MRDAPFGVFNVMSDEFDFEPRLGKIGHRKSARQKPFVRQVLDVAYKCGFKTRPKSSFTGQRIGRGAAWGTLASAGFMNKGGLRAVVKVRIAKLRAGNLAAPRAHLRYLQRDGVDRHGEQGKLYGPELDDLDGGAFTEKCDGDRHQFRIIVSPDDGDMRIANQGFGTDVKAALRNRLQWLTERGMVEPTPDGSVRPAAAAMKALSRGEMNQAFAKHSAASGLQAAQPMDGERFEGTYTRPISLASEKYAVFENNKEFTLVPWRPSFEDVRGKNLTGKVDGSTIAWELAGRTKGLGI
jgi:Protein of unknown function (DUF3363)